MQHEDLADALLQSLPLDERLKSPSASGFIQQRSHLKPEALRYIFDHVLEDICHMGSQKTYHGYFLVAGDGSNISMPTEVIPSAVNEKSSRKVQHHMEHLNALYDVKNERHVAFSTLPKLKFRFFTVLFILVGYLCPSFEARAEIPPEKDKINKRSASARIKYDVRYCGIKLRKMKI